MPEGFQSCPSCWLPAGHAGGCMTEQEWQDATLKTIADQHRRFADAVLQTGEDR